MAHRYPFERTKLQGAYIQAGGALPGRGGTKSGRRWFVAGSLKPVDAANGFKINAALTKSIRVCS